MAVGGFLSGSYVELAPDSLELQIFDSSEPSPSGLWQLQWPPLYAVLVQLCVLLSSSHHHPYIPLPSMAYDAILRQRRR